MKEDLLKKRVCVVTGGSKGIGKAIAIAFAEEGADVIITYRTSPEGANEAIETMKKYGGKYMAVKADAANEDEIKSLVSQVKENFGKIDVLVNNAGTIGKYYKVSEMPVEEWDRVINTDLKGVFLTTKYFLPIMSTEYVGKIINVSSELSKKGRAEQAQYISAKAGVNGFTRALALELAPDILVNTIAPGPIETDMILKDMDPEWTEKEKDVPLGRLGDVKDIAATAVLLASEYGNYYCGQWLSPNGGAIFL